jgi:hypothetical protein
MFSKFNIVQDIYELARLTQLKENHYKRIDDVKSRRRSSAVVTVEIETKAAISRTRLAAGLAFGHVGQSDPIQS